MSLIHCRFGLGQLLVEGGEPERNLTRAEAMIDLAAGQHCDLILLPETLDLCWTHPSVFNEAESIPGPRSDRLCAKAKQYNIWVCAGLTEKLGDKTYNSAILINNHGEIIQKHHKINLLTVEQPFYEIGTMVSCIDTPFGRIGLNICADNYIDGLPIGHTLARMGAQIILSPSSWTVDYSITEKDDPYGDKWLKPYGILAGWYDLIVVGTTSVGYIVGGPYEGKKSIGSSLVVGKKGLLAKGAVNEFAGDLIVVEFDVPERKERGTEIGAMLRQRGWKYDEPLPR